MYTVYKSAVSFHNINIKKLALLTKIYLSASKIKDSKILEFKWHR